MGEPKGPRLPALLQTLMFSLTNPFGRHLWAQRRFGDVYKVRNLVFGDQVVVCDPELVREIFTAPGDHLAAGEANSPLSAFVGESSVLVLDGKEHVRHRSILQPSFHGAGMRRYALAMRDATDAELDTWGAGDERALLPAMQRITLEVILRTVFGLDGGPRHHELRRALSELMEASGSVWGILFMQPTLQRGLGALGPWARIRRRIARVDELIYREIAQRRRERTAANAPERHDVLTSLLDAQGAQGQAFRDEELRDELITLLVAGHETTATALAWAFERLLAHPEVLTRVSDELAQVLGDAPLSEEHLTRLPYLEATIHEVLRMRPPAPFVGRQLKAPYRLAGHLLPAGCVVSPSALGIHFRPDLYPEPQRFRPERFLNQRVDRYKWIPFGGGSRRCLGMAFSLFEMKVVLAVTLPRVALTLVRPAPLRVVPRGFLIAPRGGTEVHVRAVVPRKRLVPVEAPPLSEAS